MTKYVAFFGDSITRGFGLSGWAPAHYPDSLPQVALSPPNQCCAALTAHFGETYVALNYGLSGNTASNSRPDVFDGYYGYLTGCLQYNPVLLMWMLGANDVLAGVTANSYGADMQMIVTQSRLDSGLPVIVNSPLYRSDYAGITNCEALLRAYAGKCDALTDTIGGDQRGYQDVKDNASTYLQNPGPHLAAPGAAYVGGTLWYQQAVRALTMRQGRYTTNRRPSRSR